MRNNGEIRIGCLTIIFIAIIVAAFMGIIGFKHIFLFPLYVIGVILLTIIILLAVLFGAIFIISKFMD